MEKTISIQINYCSGHWSGVSGIARVKTPAEKLNTMLDYLGRMIDAQREFTDKFDGGKYTIAKILKIDLT